MDPLVNRIGSMPGALETGAESGSPKQGPSKFDKAMERLGQNFEENCSLLGAAGRIPPARQQELRTRLRKRLERNPSATPVQLFEGDLKVHEARLSDVVNRVAALPKVRAFDALRNHLSGLESQYLETGRSISALGASPPLQDLLRLQQDVYRMSQNLEIFSRLVDQAVTGIKTIIQTQV
jgi:hypothetical protein